MMLSLLRSLVALPLELVWERLTRDSVDAELARIRQDLIDLAEGQ